MKALYLTIAVLSILAATAVNAQDYEQDYDVINKENLQNQAGFATLRGGNEITQDVRSVDNQKPRAAMAQPMPMAQAPQQPVTPSQPTIAMQPAIVEPQQPTMPMQQQPAVATTPVQQTAPMQETVTANAETQMLDATQFNDMQPAAGTAAPVAQPEVIMVEDTKPQTVVKKKTIIGNTDTGVNPEAVLKALERQQN